MLAQAALPVPLNFGRQLEKLVVVACRLIALITRNRNAHRICKALDRLDETHVVVVHQKADGRAVRAAAEAVVEAFRRADRERRGLLVMERAACLELAAGLLELHAAADDLDDVCPSDQVVDKILGNQSGHVLVNASSVLPGFESLFLLLDPGASPVPTSIANTAQSASPGWSQAAPRRALTLAPTAPMSARPAAFDLMMPMTLPMSRMLAAPVVRIASSISVSSSASSSCSGR